MTTSRTTTKKRRNFTPSTLKSNSFLDDAAHRSTSRTNYHIMFLKGFTALSILVAILSMEQSVMTKASVTALQSSSSSATSSSRKAHPPFVASTSALSSSSLAPSSSSSLPSASRLPNTNVPMPSSQRPDRTATVANRRRHRHHQPKSPGRPFISSALSSILSTSSTSDLPTMTKYSSSNKSSRSRGPILVSKVRRDSSISRTRPTNNKSSTTKDAADRQRLYNLSQQRHQHPLLSLNLNLDSLAELGAADRAQEFLQRIDALYTEGYYDVSPDVVSYNSVLKAWKEHDDPEGAMELLEKMISTAHAGSSSVAAAEAERNEQQLDSTHPQSSSSPPSLPQPAASSTVKTTTTATATATKSFDVISCNTVMAAFAQRGQYEETIDLLRRMQQRHDYPSPDTISYNSCLYALARSSLSLSSSSSSSSRPSKTDDDSKNYQEGEQQRRRRPTAFEAALEAEKVLNEMEDDPNVNPDTFSFNTVLYAWLRAASNLGINNDNCEDGEMETSVLTAARRADKLLTTMENLADVQNDVNVTTRNKKRIKNFSVVGPDQYSYTTTMQAYAKAQRPDKARDVLERMILRGVQPNRHVCTALMSAWSKAGKVEEAQRMLYQLIDDFEMAGHVEYKPDTATFSSVIDGWARVSSTDRPEAAMHAVELLEQMKEWADIKYGDDTFRPNAQTYTSVFSALAKSGTWDACDEVQCMLEELEDDYDQATSTGKNSSGSHADGPLVDDKYSAIVRPTNIHYNALLLAHAKSPRENKVQLANEVFRKMKQHPRLDCRPDTISYNTLLLSCANTSDGEMRQDAFRIALDTFHELVRETQHKDELNNNRRRRRSSVEATSTTFNHFLKTARQCIPSKKQRAAVLSKTLRICCEMGMMNHLIVHQVQVACKSNEEWNEIAGPEIAKYIPWRADFKHSCRNVPKRWKKNARR